MKILVKENPNEDHPNVLRPRRLPGRFENLPLKQPLGPAVDASGNLYVANHNSNNILIYNSAYVQQTSETITSGINIPTGLQIDPYGNLWVANYNQSNGGSSGSIAEYTNLAMQSGNTIINGIVGPQNIAFDGLGNFTLITMGAT